MTTYHFADEVERQVDDTTPIIFTWPRAGVTPVVTVALDNVNYAALTATVEEIIGGTPRYQINYSVEDRLTAPGILTYKITEGGDEAYLQLRITPSIASTVESISYSEFGPKRVKTKEMEIEQWDPRIIQDATNRAANDLPNFSNSHFSVGVPYRKRIYERNKYNLE